MTVEQAAVQLGKSPKTVRRWIQSGRLPAERHDTASGWAYRINVQALTVSEGAIAVKPSPAAPATEQWGPAILKALEERDAQHQAAIDKLTGMIQNLQDELTRRLPDATPVAEIAAPVPADQQAQERPPVARRRRWWAFWQKDDG